MEIENFPNYLIYPDGRVKNKKNDKFRSQHIGSRGYYIINLCHNGIQKTHKVHRLVAMHYIANPENKEHIDHKNRNRLDNRVENLRWATRSENQQNRSMMNTNISGHKYISYDKSNNQWRFQKRINQKLYMRCFKSKIDALCYKFIFLMINN